MVNQEWIDAGHIANTTFLSFGFQTDHLPVVTKVFADIRGNPKPFKFFNYWMDHLGFERTIKENWKINMVGSKLYTLYQRGKAYKQVLKAFNFKEFSNISPKRKRQPSSLKTSN